MTYTVIVNKELIKTINPSKYNLDVRNQKGEILHILDDGFYLIHFKHLLIKMATHQYTPLQWYIHKNDLREI